MNNYIVNPEQSPVRKSCLSGFTLIELLVVVLIIGILASVALPRYERAVEKSRASQAFNRLSTIYEAQRLWYMANGGDGMFNGAESFEDLAVSLPCKSTGYSGPEGNRVEICYEKDFFYTLGGTGGGGRTWWNNTAFRLKSKTGTASSYVLRTDKDKNFQCCAKAEDTEKCYALGMNKASSSQYASGMPCYVFP